MIVNLEREVRKLSDEHLLYISQFPEQYAIDQEAIDALRAEVIRRELDPDFVHDFSQLKPEPPKFFEHVWWRLGYDIVVVFYLFRAVWIVLTFPFKLLGRVFRFFRRTR